MRYLIIVLSVVSMLLALPLKAAVRLPQIFGDNMVLQRNQSVPVWGWADPDEAVTLTFAGQTKTTTAKDDGTWSLALDPLKASHDPAEFTVRGANTITLKNVVVGEVWLCSGQSNMEWPVQRSTNSGEEIAAANFPLIRHFRSPRLHKAVPQDDIKANWVVTSPDTIASQSAVAYFFGRRLHQTLNVPIGLINSSWGGTRIEPWTPACGFDDLPTLADIRERVATANPTTDKHKQILNDYLNKIDAWIGEAKKLQAANQPQKVPPAFPSHLTFPEGNGAHQQPTVLYNSMISGLVPFAIKGAIWYQGESNKDEGMLYLDKTKALVQGWRKVWQQGDFPYYLVQLAPFKYGGNPLQLPVMWEVQAATESAIPNTGMAVINDISTLNDIHPPNKQDVGLRLANQALYKDYGHKEIIWSGPLYRSYSIEGNRMKIEFDHADGLKTRDGKAPDWFELAGADGQFKSATAIIEGNSIVLTAEDIAEPFAMRFAWHQLAEPNLVNDAGLPTSAFRCGKKQELDGALTLNELEGFRKMYEIDLPLHGNFGSKKPAYTTDNSANPGNFSRVAYLMQLQTGAGTISYVCTIMDAFTKDATKLGIPYKGSNIKHQTKVNNLTVRSNVRNVPALDNHDGGNIEFWGLNYGQNSTLNLPGANNSKYDFDDSPANDGGYGCMQIHSWKNKITLMAYNNFNGGSKCDIGIGNNTAGEHPDYTFMANGDKFTTRRLTILVK